MACPSSVGYLGPATVDILQGVMTDGHRALTTGGGAPHELIAHALSCFGSSETSTVGVRPDLQVGRWSGWVSPSMGCAWMAWLHGRQTRGVLCGARVTIASQLVFSGFHSGSCGITVHGESFLTVDEIRCYQ